MYKRSLPVFFLCLGLLSCGKPNDAEVNPQQAKRCEDPSLCATSTIYYTPTVDLRSYKCSKGKLLEAKDADGELIVELCRGDYQKILLNGSGKIIDHGEAYTLQLSYYDAESESYVFYKKDGSESCEYACGSSGLCLEPYFSIAADPRIYPFGTVIYIPKLDGLRLPDGRIHNGQVRVEDRGGAIRGEGRFDFYTGELDHFTFDNPFIPLGMSDKKTYIEYEVYSLPQEEVFAQRECWK